MKEREILDYAVEGGNTGISRASGENSTIFNAFRHLKKAYCYDYSGVSRLEFILAAKLDPLFWVIYYAE